MMVRALFALLLVWPATAMAQETGEAGDAAGEAPAFDVVGAWMFETEWYNYGVERQLRGEMVLRVTAEGGMSCRITNGEYNRGDEEPFVNAVQKCSVRRVHNAVLVRSEVIEANSDGYRPDHFNLRIVDNDTMIGEVFSWAPMGDVKFIRIEQNIS